MARGKNENFHTISVLVANKPGVLVRCAQVFARRGFNIDALVVSPGVDPKFSRMTITAQGDPATLDQIIKQTAKLIDVVHCQEHTDLDAVDREYAMVKVKASSPATKTAIKKVIKAKAHILDDSNQAMIIGQTGTSDELDALEEQLKKFGIVEMVRSGKLVMARGKEPT
ncbi:MAG: acetolactate synthase small subunit [Candidatus Omnitrophica bacterium]|nr:acetolactate synthase small subunit [Candidatus Omnitrophota bacterium]